MRYLVLSSTTPRVSYLGSTKFHRDTQRQKWPLQQPLPSTPSWLRQPRTQQTNEPQRYVIAALARAGYSFRHVQTTTDLAPLQCRRRRTTGGFRRPSGGRVGVCRIARMLDLYVSTCLAVRILETPRVRGATDGQHFPSFLVASRISRPQDGDKCCRVVRVGHTVVEQEND